MTTQTEDLLKRLQAEGYQISRSAVHRYGQKVERRFASIKASTEAARLIAEGAADEGDTRSEALMAMLQTELFDALVQIGEMPSVSTHSRPKAAGLCVPAWTKLRLGFNSQPPEGGWA